jgi:hypothetical protein
MGPRRVFLENWLQLWCVVGLKTCCKHARAPLNSSASSITVQGERGGGGADDDDDEACIWAYLMCSKAFSAPPSLSHMAIMPCVKCEYAEPADKNEDRDATHRNNRQLQIEHICAPYTVILPLSYSPEPHLILFPPADTSSAHPSSQFSQSSREKQP